MKLIRYGQRRLLLDVEEIAELERPAMIDLVEYQDKYGIKTLSSEQRYQSAA
jgi:hypothetical protein